IFASLPTPTYITARCVSRQWYALINLPSQVIAHIYSCKEKLHRGKIFVTTEAPIHNLKDVRFLAAFTRQNLAILDIRGRLLQESVFNRQMDRDWNIQEHCLNNDVCTETDEERDLIHRLHKPGNFIRTVAHSNQESSPAVSKVMCNVKFLAYIFNFLPFKFLLNVRSVSKQWLRIVNIPNKVLLYVGVISRHIRSGALYVVTETEFPARNKKIRSVFIDEQRAINEICRLQNSFLKENVSYQPVKVNCVGWRICPETEHSSHIRERSVFNSQGISFVWSVDNNNLR
ncbi:11000_t:CDS:1, partial [Acaulospora morrowiae]